jgi:hypothetical protein
MDKLQAYKIIKEAARLKATNNLVAFMQYTNPSYVPVWFHKQISEKCEDLLAGKIKKLMIFVPPQHGKSEIVSRSLPAYAFGKNPNYKIAECSYSADLAESFSRDVQRKIESQAYKEIFPNTYLNKSNVRNNAKGNFIRTVEKFEIADHNGFYKAVGVGGPLTGNPVDIGIIDDPIKDAIEASSQTYRDRVWDWYLNVFKTRMHNDSKEILMMTRWNKDDLAGRILEAEGAEWEVLVYKGIAEEHKAIDPRDIGEALWEEKHSAKRLLEYRKLSKQTFAALIQQNPLEGQKGGEFLKQWETERHVGTYPYNPKLAVRLIFDENVNPYFPCAIFQVEEDQKTARLIHVISLEDPNNTTVAMLREIKRKLAEWNHAQMVFIGGDATSQKEDVKQEKGHDLFHLIMVGLSSYRPRRIVGTANPSVIMSKNFVNSILESEILGLSLGVDKSCRKAILDFENTKEDKNGKVDKKTFKDPITKITSQPYGHYCDILRYFFTQTFANEYSSYLSGGPTNIPIIGKNITKNRL